MVKEPIFTRIIKNKLANELYIELLKNWHNTQSLSRFKYKGRGTARPNVTKYFHEWLFAGFLTSTELTENAKRRSVLGKIHTVPQPKIKYRANSQAFLDYCWHNYRWKPKKKTLEIIDLWFSDTTFRKGLINKSKPSINIFENMALYVRNELYYLIEKVGRKSYLKEQPYNMAVLIDNPDVCADLVGGLYKDLSDWFKSILLQTLHDESAHYSLVYIVKSVGGNRRKSFKSFLNEKERYLNLLAMLEAFFANRKIAGCSAKEGAKILNSHIKKVVEIGKPTKASG